MATSLVTLPPDTSHSTFTLIFAFMLRTVLTFSLAGSLFALDAAAQNGRSMRLLAPAVIGHTASVAFTHPTSISGSVYGILASVPRYPGTGTLGGSTVVNGLFRVDPFAFTILAIGLLDTSGVSPAFSFGLPNDSALVGFPFDMQGVDVAGDGSFTLTDDDIEFTIAAPWQIGLSMAPIAPGTFQMGSSAAFPTEVPVHTVTISRPFWIGMYEVTQGQFQQVMGYNPSAWANTIGAVSRPVESVTWAQAMAYCQTLTAQETAAGRVPTGYQYRLPTEAEWEYCCRAGTATDYNFGATIDCNHANVAPNSNLCVGMANFIGQYPGNAWALRDMHGNVSEWCLDSWDAVTGYAPGAVTDPYEPNGGQFRITRGGSWSSIEVYCRSASRGVQFPNQGSLTVGFRVVLAPVIP